jgi:hypothetical protein
MNGFVKASLLVALIGGLLGVYTFVSAQAPPSSIRESVEGTYFDEGYYQGGFAVGGGMTVQIGTPLAVTCPGKSACTILADLFVQTGAGTTPKNLYSACMYVDGVRALNCQDVGTTPEDGTYLVGEVSNMQVGVAPGNHVVQTYFWTQNGASVYNHTSIYRVYKP